MQAIFFSRGTIAWHLAIMHRGVQDQVQESLLLLLFFFFDICGRCARAILLAVSDDTEPASPAPNTGNFWVAKLLAKAVGI